MSSSEQPQSKLPLQAPVAVMPAGKDLGDGLYLLARVDCLPLKLEAGALTLHVPTGRLELRAQCGCFVHVSFANMVGQLLMALTHPEHDKVKPAEAPAVVDAEPTADSAAIASELISKLTLPSGAKPH